MFRVGRRRSIAEICYTSQTGINIMRMNVCLSTSNTLRYPQGGHLWVFINWALALRACGCDLVWLNVAPSHSTLDETVKAYRTLSDALRPFGLAEAIAVDTLAEDDATLQFKKVGLPTLDERDAFDVPYRSSL